MISVQILRAVAALMVVIFHASLKSQLLGLSSSSFTLGAAGVDLFFIISGFIMVYITKNKNFSFIAFMKNRLLRIMPLYWLLTLIAFLVYLYNPSLVNSHNGQTSIASSFTLIPIKDTVMLLEVGWTLRYEFLFYLIFSASIILFRLPTLACFSIIIMLCALPAFGINGFYVQYISNPITIEFLFGIIAYYIYKKDFIKSSILFIITLTTLLLMKEFIYDYEYLRAIYYGIPMLTVFCLAIMFESLINKCKSLSIRCLKIIGDSSYSLYLSHLFTLGVCARIHNYFPQSLQGALVFLTFSILASILAGILCFKVIETPLSKITKKSLMK